MEKCAFNTFESKCSISLAGSGRADVIEHSGKLSVSQLLILMHSAVGKNV